MMLLDLKQILEANPRDDSIFDFQVGCHCCGAKSMHSENKLKTVCSVFGGYSISLCEECLSQQKEPYGQMVASTCISCGTNFPEGINDAFLSEIRRQLNLHNVTEEEFIEDLKQCDYEMSRALDFSSNQDNLYNYEGGFF